MKSFPFHSKQSLGYALLCLFLCAVVVSSTPARAQTVPDLSDISITMIPLNPAPGQTTVLTAQSFSMDLSQASLSWTYGGKTVVSGLGKTSISVQAPAAGVAATATVAASGNGQAPVSASISLHPASVDMLWEAADAYTPPFYKGKAELPIEGALRIVAVPAPNAPQRVTFSWSRNGSALPTASGLNQLSVVLQNTIFNKTEQVAVNVYGGTFQGNGTVSVNTTAPTMLAYLNKDGFIDYAHGATDTIVVPTDGTTIHFEPYNFSAQGLISQALSYVLKVDGSQVAGDPMPNELRISQPNKDNNNHSIAATASTPQYSVQNVTKTFTILFQ